MKKRKKQSKNKTGFAFAMLSPVTLVLVFLIVIPLIYIVIMSFMTRGTYGGIVYKPTLENYKAIFDKLYLDVMMKSVGWSLISTVLCLLIGYPVAYRIAGMPKKRASTVILLIMVPFWTSSMARLYNFVILMNTSGVINTVLMKLYIIKAPLQMLYTGGAVVVGMVYCLLPFAILPLYTSIAKLDRALVEASKDLGANAVKTFFKITFPLTSGGVFASVILVFIPSLGYYYVTDIMGGGTSLVMGTLIKAQFTTAKNWPMGATISLVLILVTILLLFLYGRKGNLDDLGVR